MRRFDVFQGNTAIVVDWRPGRSHQRTMKLGESTEEAL